MSSWSSYFPTNDPELFTGAIAVEPFPPPLTEGLAPTPRPPQYPGETRRGPGHPKSMGKVTGIPAAFHHGSLDSNRPTPQFLAFREYLLKIPPWRCLAIHLKPEIYQILSDYSRSDCGHVPQVENYDFYLVSGVPSSKNPPKSCRTSQKNANQKNAPPFPWCCLTISLESFHACNAYKNLQSGTAVVVVHLGPSPRALIFAKVYLIKS